VIDDPGVENPLDVRRVALCSGKVGYEAMEQRDGLGAPLAVVRIEQLYPWPGDKIEQVLQRYPNAESIVWLQEEPANMGPWSFVQLRSTEETTLVHRLSLVSRPESGSPACGSMGVHQQEFALLMNDLAEGL
jgi:2-oxoglutarate dehydrogenase complex dehydrogenase (E1) component-like enzyme